MRNLLYFLTLFVNISVFAQTVKPKCIDGNCRNKFGTYRYADSSIYTGAFNDKMRNGKGKIQFKDGSSYEGDWKMNIKEGYGTYFDSDGGKHEGLWLNDSKHGRGKYTDKKKNIYEGTWTNGELLGDVVIAYCNKALYKGKYNKGKEGYGEFLDKDGGIYAGSWSNDKRNGFGKMTYKSGATYEGDWVNDNRQGKGTYIDSLNDIYEGSWFDDHENGFGKYTDANGNIYEGTWVNGEVNGYVTIRYTNHNIYEGEYLKGLQGKGKLIYADSSVYTGNFLKNNRSGYGEFVYHFGLTYKGNWVSNEIEGHGGFYETKTQNKLASGNWKTQNLRGFDLIILGSNGYMVRFYANKDLYYGQSIDGLPNGIGTIIYNGGERYDGNFLTGRYDGYGHFLYNDKSEYKGEWKNGLWEGFGTKVRQDRTEENGYYEKGIYIGKEKPLTNEFVYINGIKGIKIGEQTWIAQNLNVDRFRNGDLIPHAINNEDWERAGERGQPAWCYYDNGSSNEAKYGKLYNWYAVNDPRGLAPKGWHIASEVEWLKLANHFGGKDIAGKKIKADGSWCLEGNYDFDIRILEAKNFNAVSGGERLSRGIFSAKYTNGFWFCASAVNYISLNSGSDKISFLPLLTKILVSDNKLTDKKKFGFSVRCVID